jgi:hypothetical protein
MESVPRFYRQPDAVHSTRSARTLNVIEAPIITVIGKAFFDVGHSLKDQSKNRRKNLPGCVAWEIHPAMKVTVQ